MHPMGTNERKYEQKIAHKHSAAVSEKEKKKLFQYPSRYERK